MSADNTGRALTRAKERQLRRVAKKLAARRITVLGDGFWEVASARGGTHLISYLNERWGCTECPYFSANMGPCDHIFMIRQFLEEGQPLTLQPETREPRVQTQRNWSFYKAFRRDAPRAIELMLRDICFNFLSDARLIEGHVGRPALSVRDAIICINARRMVRGSGLEADWFVHAYHDRGWLLHPESPMEDSISNAMSRSDILDEYTRLLGICATSVRDIETTFAIDAQRWRTPCSRYDVYVKDASTGQKRWRKANFMHLQALLGCSTKLVAAIAILTEEDGESPQAIPLLERGLQFFAMKMLLCDTAYSEGKARQWLRDHGIVARIPFRSNSRLIGDGSAWDFDLADFLDADDHYWADYVGRLVIESYFAALLRNNGNAKKLRSKLMGSQACELMSMVLNYQLRMLLNAILQHNIDVPWLAQDTRKVIGQINDVAIDARKTGLSNCPIVTPQSNLLIFPSRQIAQASR